MRTAMMVYSPEGYKVSISFSDEIEMGWEKVKRWGGGFVLGNQKAYEQNRNVNAIMAMFDGLMESFQVLYCGKYKLYVDFWGDRQLYEDPHYYQKIWHVPDLDFDNAMFVLGQGFELGREFHPDFCDLYRIENHISTT